MLHYVGTKPEEGKRIGNEQEARSIITAFFEEKEARFLKALEQSRKENEESRKEIEEKSKIIEDNKAELEEMKKQIQFLMTKIK